MKHRRLLAAAALLLAALSGCETVPVVPETPPDDAARQLLAQGQYREAAAAFLTLAGETAPPASLGLRLSAVDALLRAGDLDAAALELARVGDVPLPEPLETQRRVVSARVALAEGRTRDALELLAEPAPPESLPWLAADLGRARAEAFEQAGNYIEAARERTRLELLLTSPADLSANRRSTWAGLSRLAPAALAQVNIPPPDTLGGWVELAKIARLYVTDPDTLASAIELWSSQFPGHPANESIVPELIETSRLGATPPTRIALLLPFEGPFAKAAGAIRDGFLAAWYSDPGVARPAVDVYDTAAADIWSVYAQAVESGADFVVGPLEKERVARLALSPRLPVPTLALNHAEPPAPAPVTETETGTGAAEGTEAAQSDAGAAQVADTGTGGPAGVAPADAASDATAQVTDDALSADPEPVPTTPADTVTGNLYQFALSPEAEARQVAERAWFEGRVNAAVLTPEGKWGERVEEAFVTAWEGLGGIVVERQRYPTSAQAMSAAVARLVNVDESAERWRSLRRTLGADIKHEARRRQDLHFVFMAAFPRQARQLQPQLDFHRAAGVPVYATSHVFTGEEDRERNGDVNGVRFGDMPWVLAPGAPGTVLRPAVERAWPDTAQPFLRLYAFGVDAYQVIPDLGRLRAQRYAEVDGATGWLSVGDDSRIQRRLVWAQFRDGAAVLLDAEPEGP